MGLFSKNKAGGILNVIRCDEPSYLIWKWHPEGSPLGSTTRENAIRWGSSLRVKDGEVVVFVYHQKNGVFQDYIVGPFDQQIKTKNLPILSGIIGLAYNGKSPFQAEIYFINLARIIQVRFGVPFFDVYDPRLPDYGVPTAVRGTLSFNITDYEDFIKHHRLINFDLNTFQSQIRDAITRYVKDAVANAPAASNIPLLQIETKTAQINDAVEYDVKQRLKEDFGVTVTGMDIGAIELDKTSDAYQQLLRVTRDLEGAKAKATAGAEIRKIEAEAEDYEEKLRIQREESQYALHKQTQSGNIAAFTVEKQAEVGVSGAEALGQMGANGAGGVDLGGNGAGFNPAAMMAGMALGGAVGQNIAGTMHQMMGGMNMQQTGVPVPPPIPTAAYHVAVNGQATGPYTLDVLRQMANANGLTGGTLVWKPGMAAWTRADAVAELAPILQNSMPPIPPQP